MVKIRLMGTPDDVATLAACLGELVEILESSQDYANRRHSPLVRRYLTCRVTDRTLERVGRLLHRQEPAAGHPPGPEATL
jgi:hypothetical protein